MRSFRRRLLTATLASLPAALWANAGLPIYSHGFGFFTGFFAFPLIWLGESLVLWSFVRTEGRGFGAALKACFRANVVSTIGGMVLMPLLHILLSWIWSGLGGSDNALIVLRRMFAASFLTTVLMEAFAYRSSLAGTDSWKWPEKKYWVWSLAANCLSYGTIAWMLVTGALSHEDMTPWLFRLLQKQPYR